MRFGVVIAPRIDDWAIFREAEDLGFDSAWACDSQMLWSDCYATLALAAAHTDRIALGTGVAAAGTRPAPVTAHSIASVSKLAPGRTFLGIGTGHTSMRVMGRKPMPVPEFADYVRTVRALLAGEEVDLGAGNHTRFLNRDHGFIDLDHSIPILVGANGPRALRLAGAEGDGLVTIAATDPDDIRNAVKTVSEGAAAAGRDLSSDYPVTSMVNVVVLQDGEPVCSPRVVAMTDSWVGAAIHFAYEMWAVRNDESVVPPPFRPFWEEYCAHVDAMTTPADRRYLELHDGHATWLAPVERRFLTEEAIRAVTIVGPVDEVVDRIREAERAGVTELALQSPLATARDVMRDFAEKVRPQV